DLDASWAALDEDGNKIEDRTKETEYQEDSEAGILDDEKMVTIVQCQYWEKESYYRVALPSMVAEAEGDQPGGVKNMAVEDYEPLAEKLALLGAQAIKLERRVVWQCFFGRKVLKRKKAPCPEHFSFNCITAFRDRNAGTFYGLVRGMKDPQRWANKWMSQTLHIMNSTAKGGLLAEKGIAEDQRQFEQTYAKAEAITWVEDGAIVQGRIQEKTASALPQGFFQLMTFAISAIRDVSGINLEMLGMREADQPASLEFQRRQAGITILAQLFRSMRRYHRDQGKVLLYYIQTYLSDNRLIRIVGKEGAQYVPLVRQAESKYDIIVDEGPTSPNQKERVWQLIGPNFWALPPMIQMVLLDYSPFPSSVVEAVKAAAKEASEGPQAQFEEKMQALNAMLVEAKALLTQAQAKESVAKAGLAEAETLQTVAEIGRPTGIDGRVDQGVDRELEFHRLAASTATAREKTAADAAVRREKTATDATIAREKMMTDAETKVTNTVLGAMLKPGPKQPGVQ
ncbi:MAG: hypothetical protein ACREEE_17855, partial [Dongiaceae bacterium]